MTVGLWFGGSERGLGGVARGAGVRLSSEYRAILTIGAMQAAAMAFNLLRGKVVAVTVGPEGVGVISVVDQIVALVAQVASLSLPFAAVKLLAQAHSESTQAFARGYAALLRGLLAASAVGMGLAAVTVLGWGDALLPEFSGVLGVLVLALCGVPALNLTAFLTNVLAAARRVRGSALMGVLSAASLAVASVTGILVAGLAGFYAGSVVGASVLVVGALLYLRRREGLPVREGPVRVIEEIRRYPAVVNLAGSLYLTAFTAPLAYLVARYAVVRTAGITEAGLLQAAMGPALALGAVLRSSNALFLTPAVNRRGDGGEKLRSAVEFQRALSVVAAILALPIVLFPGWWLRLLYSDGFVVASPYVYLFVLGEMLLLLAGVNQALVIGLDDIRTHLAVSLGGHAAIILTSLWLVPKYGIGGVAAALLANSLVIMVVTMARLSATHRMAVCRTAGWVPAVAMLAVGAAGVVAVYTEQDTPISLLLKAAACVVVGGLGVGAFRGWPAGRLSAVGQWERGIK